MIFNTSFTVLAICFLVNTVESFTINVRSILSRGLINRSRGLPLKSEPLVPRLDARTASPEQFFKSIDGQRVAIISNSFFTDERGRDQWTEEFFRSFAHESVTWKTFDSKRRIKVHSGKLEAFVEQCYSSTHDFPVFLMDEDILGNSAPEIVVGPISKLPKELWPDGDGFDFFPKQLRPKKPCLIMGGAGARSSLHADPMAWTGWNYLVEGSKLWTFYPPANSTDAAFKARRVVSDAWDTGAFNASAGWESALDLFLKKTEASTAWPCAEDLGRMTAMERDVAFQKIVEACTRDNPFQTSERLDSAVSDQRLTILQRAGELVLIPPRWWHQTYHLEPTVAFAGQYLNTRNEANVTEHICSWCGVSKTTQEALGSLLRPIAPTKVYKEGPADRKLDPNATRLQIRRLLEAAMLSKHGKKKAQALIQLLYDKSLHADEGF